MDWPQIGLISFQLIIFAVMLLGLFSLFVLIVPGLVIIWIAALIYGIITGFNWISGIILFFITVLMIVGNMLDNIFIGAGAKSQGASWWAIGGALVAGIAGSIFWPPFGGLLAALVGLFLVELIRLRNFKTAYTSTRGMLLGCGWALVTRFAVGGIMILWWVVWVAIEWFTKN